MKVIFWVTIILVTALTVNAQQNNDDYKTMIDSAVTMKYTQFLETVKRQKNENHLKNLYLLNEQDQPLNYISSSGKFKSINVYDDRNKKILSKGIYAWKVLTSLSKNKLIITIIDFYITYKKSNYNFSNGGGTRVVYEYSCDENKWKLITYNNQGI